jgi:hypothetical protein
LILLAEAQISLGQLLVVVDEYYEQGEAVANSSSTPNTFCKSGLQLMLGHREDRTQLTRILKQMGKLEESFELLEESEPSLEYVRPPGADEKLGS